MYGQWGSFFMKLFMGKVFKFS